MKSLFAFGAVVAIALFSSAMFAQGTRTLRVVNVDTSAGSIVTVPVELDSLGNEVAFGFSLQFDQTKLTLRPSTPGGTPDTAVGAGSQLPPTYSVTPNANQAASGRIGVFVDGPLNGPIAAGTKQVITVTFDVAPGAPAGLTPVTFVDSPITRSTSDNQANPLATSYTNGNVNITGPSAAGVSITGRVLNGGGQGLRGATVFITDSQGNRRTVMTNSFGVYRFDDVEAGQNYLMGVSASRYRFQSRNIQVSDNLTDVDFIGQQ